MRGPRRETLRSTDAGRRLIGSRGCPAGRRFSVAVMIVRRRSRARVGGTPRRSTVSFSVGPSRSDAAAPGWVRSSSRAWAARPGRVGPA
jgi:hypothetical protein